MKNFIVAASLLSAVALAAPAPTDYKVDWDKVDYSNVDYSKVDWDKVKYPPGTGAQPPKHEPMDGYRPVSSSGTYIHEYGC